MPNYRQPQEDDRVRKLAVLAQVMQGFQGQQQQAQSDQQRNAMGVLGLILNNQREQEQAQALQQYRKDTLDEQRGQGAQQLKQIFAAKILDDPNIPLEQKRAALSKLDPSFAEPLNAMHESALTGAAQRRTPEFAAIYEAGKNDPAKLAKGINALRMVTSDEEFNRQPWDRLNAGLPAANVVPGATDAVPEGVPPEILARIAQQQKEATDAQLKTSADMEAERKRNLVFDYISRNLPSTGQQRPPIRLGY